MNFFRKTWVGLSSPLLTAWWSWAHAEVFFTRLSIVLGVVFTILSVYAKFLDIQSKLRQDEK
ncbi:MAG: hypothetical protein AAFY71_07810 [Bacteroidota bacterium]